MAHPRVDAAVTARPALRPLCSMTVKRDARSRTIDTIRALAMDAVQKANAGHPGTAMALAPLAYLLYRDVLRHNPADPHWPGRDRFILSAGHACILQYASLHLAGYDVTLDDLQQFRQWGSRTPGHPELGHTPASRRRRGHSARASPTASGSRSPSGSSPSATTGQDTRSSILDLRHLLRRRPDGGRVAGGGLDRGPPRARASRLRLRRQPHHDRRHDVARFATEDTGSASRRTAGMSSMSRTPRISTLCSLRSQPPRPRRSGRP